MQQLHQACCVFLVQLNFLSLNRWSSWRFHRSLPLSRKIQISATNFDGDGCQEERATLRTFQNNYHWDWRPWCDIIRTINSWRPYSEGSCSYGLERLHGITDEYANHRLIYNQDSDFCLFCLYGFEISAKPNFTEEDVIRCDQERDVVVRPTFSNS